MTSARPPATAAQWSEGAGGHRAAIRPTAVPQWIAAALVLATLTGCAEMAPPPGGPPDTTPPYVLAASPESLATGVDSTTAVAITFSEKIDRASARDWFFMNPYVPIRDVDWDGPTMRVRFQGTLPPATTFEVFLGSGVRDRAGLPLSPRFSRLFSTGPTIAEGVVEGRVLRGRKRPTSPGTAGAGTPPPQSPPTTTTPTPGTAGTTVQTSVPRDAIFVWLFPLAGDTLPDPTVESPAWVGEAGPDGRFALRGVPIHASYHLLALYDADRSKGPGSSRDYWTFHPDTLVLTGFGPAATGLEVELIDPKSPAEVAGRLAAPVDTTVADTLAYGVLAAPVAADTGAVSPSWPPLTGLQSARVMAGGNFSLRALKPGAWRLAAFRDDDGDGTWDTGEPLGPTWEGLLRPDDRIIDIELARPPGD